MVKQIEIETAVALGMPGVCGRRASILWQGVEANGFGFTQAVRKRYRRTSLDMMRRPKLGWVC